VRDTGEGIAPEHLPHLFDRFYRVDAARGRSAGGTGLGLAICRWVADAHGGTLEVASTVGQGTTIILWLPASRDGADQATPRLAGAPTPHQDAVPTSS
jgi:two-component system sensor histidine kinase BaeS